MKLHRVAAGLMRNKKPNDEDATSGDEDSDSTSGDEDLENQNTSDCQPNIRLIDTIR